MSAIIKADIKKRGLSQTKYADLFGVDRSSVTNWLNGHRKPSFRILMLIELPTEEIQRLRDIAFKHVEAGRVVEL